MISADKFWPLVFVPISSQDKLGGLHQEEQKKKTMPKSNMQRRPLLGADKRRRYVAKYFS